jgi:hypothetical protein
MLVAISTGLFLVVADPLSPIGLAGFVVLVASSWLAVRRQASGAAGHG